MRLNEHSLMHANSSVMKPSVIPDVQACDEYRRAGVERLDSMVPPPTPRLATVPLPFVVEGDEYCARNRGYEAFGLMLYGV